MATIGNTYDPPATASALATKYTAGSQTILTAQTKQASAAGAALTSLRTAISSYQTSLMSLTASKTMLSQSATFSNTAIGTASIDKDLLNVGRVLRLGWFAKLTRLILPSALPYIFTGMRLSLGVGWMVLIAAEMLSQNPGLGKFVWDEFQNGSSQSLARIMFAVLVIGFIGFGLDRAMSALQALANRNHTV